ncbi:hypothetical protein HPB52_019659 [Rhipicephalus sanguineus]|uniref:Reverse transcriptase n=1 Tax=Rhipicephalus sanguineus TaxID=34632 RepID=A0A9D4SRX2_RHISA|nr:hypothetical protein HPB52_019659 [Rhipicephalus sanguineus]
MDHTRRAFSVFSEIYAPPYSPLESVLEELERALLSSTSPHVIVAGDVNSKHRLWGPVESDERGLILAQFALAHRLLPLNDVESLPTYETPYTASWLDLSFATPSVVSTGYSWTVHDDTTYSEHRLVEVRIGLPPEPGKRLTRYAQRELLRALQDHRWFGRASGASLGSPDALDAMLASLYNLFDRLYRRNLRPHRARPHSKPWFTPDLAIERSAVAAKRRRFQRARDPAMRNFYRAEYTAALSTYRSSIKTSRDQHIRGYALSCVQRSLFAAPFKAASGRLHQYRCLPSLLAPDSTCTTTHLESAALLLRTQIAVDDPATDTQAHTVTRALATLSYTTALQDVPFYHEEVVDVLRRTPNNSTPGRDNITPLLMKSLYRYHPAFFLMIFNAALSLGYFPRCWRKARVTFIHKPGRPPERTSSYRPICVSSIFGKTLERLLNGRLQYFLHANGHIHPRQYGFTRGRSSVMALHDLKEQLLRFRNNCTPAISISLDFHGAFDSVWHPYVLRYFRERLLHSKLYHLLRTFLEGRTVFLRSHAGQVEASPSLGSPQGSPLSPLLWNVVIDDLLSLRMPRGAPVQAYADDTVILVPAVTTAALSELALEVLRRVQVWADSVKVKLNPDKTFCVLFHAGVRGAARTCITLRPPGAQAALAFKESIRILGVVFDARLSLFKHADYLRDKVVLPALTYASPIWWSESRVDCRLYARMVSIQRIVLLALTGAFRTTNTAALQVSMQAAPIDLELERLNAEFRLFALRRHVAFGSLRYRPEWVALPHKAAVPHPSLPALAPFRRLSCRAACNVCRAPGIHIYTDGSYTNLSAGAAYVVLDPNPSIIRVGRYRLLHATSAYAAEVVAFMEALRHVLEVRYTSRVAIYTDCLSVLQAITSPQNVEPHVMEIRQLLNNIRRRPPIHLCHVPGHSGVFGNEVADHLSQRATRVGLLGRLPSPFRAVRRQFRQELLALWTDRWRADFRRTELYRWVQDLRDLPSIFLRLNPLLRS